jgi:peptidoglycan/LPS O-acetylase OafA/YrhL
VFFSLSGFLISTSWYREPVARVYLAKRALRIFPALVLLIVLTVFVVGVLVTTVGFAAYFGSGETWRYLANVSLLVSYDLPGVFANNPLHVVNGALWSLGPEFLCYLAVLGLGLLMRGRHVLAAVVLAVVFIAVAFVPVQPLGEIASAMAFFGVGAVIAAVARGRRLPLVPLVALIPGWLLASWALPIDSQLDQMKLAWLFLPYIVIAFGQASTPVVRRLSRFGDISYGMYLWGFLVQQLVVQLAGSLPLALNIPIVIVATAAIGFASWHLVEKRALALKPSAKRSLSMVE